MASMISDARQDSTLQTIELAFVGLNDTILLPTQALSGLQLVLSGNITGPENENEIIQWLGTTNLTKWQYVYFTKPDLIVHTRPQTIQYLAKELEDDKLLVAHRFILLPHESDFPKFVDRSLIVPALGHFANVTTVDSYRGDGCIWDGQNDKIYRHNKTCPDRWDRCGFGIGLDPKNYSTIHDVEKLFYHYTPFQLIRLKQGTGFVTLSGTESRNICQVRLADSQI
jgi:hypothetical protein